MKLAWADYADQPPSFNMISKINPTRTGHSLLKQIKQHEIDQKISLPMKEKDYRAKTKGRFAEI
jgi:hypothetical protein